MEYDFKEIERKWQREWKEKKRYQVFNDSPKPKYYVLDMFPYPSGAGLHVGHPLGYIASDIYSRYKRLKGFNVLHPMGFDSFGLPAEQYAIETGQHPAATTEKNIATFKSQLDKIGFCFDWDREVKTSDPEYYKWTQWLFLQLFNSYFCNTQKKARPISDLIKKYETKGSKDFTAAQWNAFSKKEQEDILMKRRLAFSAYGEVNWCEALGTVLANDEVVNGVSERGGYPVEKRKMRQWFLRITSYADRLLEGLETVDFSDSMKEMQRNWIGKSEGAEIEFKIQNSKFKINVYTTRPDTIFGVDFMVLAPEHELVSQITSATQKAEIEKYLNYVKSRSERERLAEAKTITGCFTGAHAINPFDGREIPIWIAEYVLAGYGTGAIMAVPCGDQRDFLFAKHFKITITNIIGHHYNGKEANPTKDAILENSGFLNGMLMKDAIGMAVNKVEELGIGKRKVNYKMRDAGFSRQRYWGEPFPIVWKDEVAIPLNENELPVLLPHVDKYGPGPNGEGPLANLKDWVDLTPNPSPKERGMKDSASYGYIDSTAEEWKKTFEFAKQNRRDSTAEEDIMWQELRNRNIAGHKFRRQHPIAGYIPDFVCLEKKLIVEIDGGYHNEADQAAFDKARAKWLEEQGFTMIRFTNDAVNTSLKTVLKDIEEALYNKQIDLSNVNSGSPLSGRGVGGEVKRETSTMPGYAGSSWYFLRYMDPHNNKTFCDRKVSDYWNQVDLYIGGTEHAVGHLLYSRMWTKVMYDLGMIGFDEPYKKLLNQGMIQGSSRFVYRITLRADISAIVDNAVEGETIPIMSSNKNILISKSIFDKIKDDPILVKQILEKNISKFGIEYFEKLKDIQGQVSMFHVDVNLVDGNELNIEAFKKWRNNEYAEAIFILEDETIYTIDSISKYICGIEVEKMSKSKYNTVNPNDLCDKYGADTFRMYEMFLGPVEASKPWDTKGIEGVHRFLRKLWRLFNDEQKGPIWTTVAPSPLERAGGEVANDAELKILHRTIKKIEEDTERFSFNTAVSTFMICVNDLVDIKCHKKEILEKLLILLTPYAPHIAEELWQQLGNQGSALDATYPAFDGKYLVESSKEYPISVNGKLRTSINIALDAGQEEVEKIVLTNEVIQKWLEGKPPKKVIFVKGKMVNVVL
jgi:leucyl-tRNA synthetase